MKKFTTIIAITLLAALLFTGCDIIPMKKDFSQYGFTLSIAGEVTDKGANLLGYTTLDTKYGELTFSKMTLNLGLTEGNIAKDTLECYLYDNIGLPLGQDYFYLYEMPLIYMNGIKFHKKGQYTFEIYQAMRDSLLTGIESLGLTIEKVDNGKE